MPTQNYDSMVPLTRSLLSELLEDSKLYKSGQDYQEMLDFVVRLRNFVPFNAFILHIQLFYDRSQSAKSGLSPLIP